MDGPAREPLRILTIGHSTRPLGEFLSLLQAHRVGQLIDVRTVPRSARNPQFNKDSLPHELTKAGIAYAHMPELGGLRHARRDSTNTGWRNASFRGYADYMETPEFDGAIATLIRRVGEAAEAAEAAGARTAIMCAEAVPWRCHRSMISDALVARGVRVEHIMGPGPPQPHRMTPFAVVEGTRVTYPGEETLL